MTDYKKYVNSIAINDSIFYEKINDNVEFYSYGCYDSRWDLETIIHQLEVEKIKEPVIFIDTCCAIDLQENISKRLVQKLAFLCPEKKMIITGCGVNYEREFYDKFGLTLSNFEKFDMKNYPLPTVKKDPFLAPHSYGAVKISDGCYYNCSYCIIHKVRPRYEFAYEDITKQIKNCLANGDTNILLFGTDISFYSKDGVDLLDLVKQILRDFPEITSIKLDSINPAYKNVNKLVSFIRDNPKMQKDLDVSVQSCSNAVLKSARRNYTVDKLFEMKKLCGDHIFVTYQLIAGLPGETEEFFQESLNNLEKLAPCLITLCPFSARKGTEACKHPMQIPYAVKKERELILRKKFNTVDIDSKFQGFRPQDMDNVRYLKADLSSMDEVKRLYDLLKLTGTNQEICIIHQFMPDQSIEDLEVNAKILIMTFGVKVITKITLDEKAIRNFNIVEFSYKIPTFLNIRFTKMPDITVDEIYRLFNMIEKYKLDDMQSVIENFIKAGNMKKIDLKYVMQKYGVSF